MGRLRVSKPVKFIILATLVCSVIAFIAVDQWSRHRFGTSLYQMAGRYLPKEITWQKEQRPSLKPILNIVEQLLPADDRYNFSAINTSFPPLWSQDWTTELAGPSTAYHSAPVKQDAFGRPSPNMRETLLSNHPLTARRDIIVDSVKSINSAIKGAQPGDIITLAPGTYHFNGRSINLKAPGTKSDPIRIRASRLGEVRLQFDLLEGFHVVAPYWIFENLEIEGVCTKHGNCEHAFHIVGAAKNITLRNLFVKNFNAPIKVNGSQSGGFPDGGLIEYSMFINDQPRETANPVTLLDIVAANDWIVRKSVIADFAKAKGDNISYAGFFKGAGQNNLYEQNLVLCELRHSGGVRIGLSFGGGGTSMSASRNHSNQVEQLDGILRRNVIANCPFDVGIYLNKSTATTIAGNLLINNTGIHVRFPESDAIIIDNTLSGYIIDRDGGQHESIHNTQSSTDNFQFPQSLEEQSVQSILKGDLASERVSKQSGIISPVLK